MPDVPPPFFAQSAEPEAETQEHEFELRGSIEIAGLAPFELSNEPLRPALDEEELAEEASEGPTDSTYTRKAPAKSSQKPRQSDAGFLRSNGFRAHGVFRRAESSLGRSGQFVMRKGKNGALAAYGSRIRNASTDNKQARLGVQADYYIGAGFLGDFALAGIVGGERSGHVGQIAGEDTMAPKKNLRPFSGFDLRYYPDADWRITAGHRYWGGDHFAAAGVQTMFLRSANVMGIASVEARMNESRAGVAWASVRLYVGAQPKTLIALQRDAHVGGWLQEDFYLPNAAASAPAQ